MPRNTRTFTDLDLNFIANPVTHDVSCKTNVNAIKQAVKNLVLTLNYERPFHPEIGSQVYNLLFEPFSPLTQAILEQTITNTINNFEPRVVLQGVTATLNNDNQTAYIQINFNIVNTQQPLVLDLALKRTR